MIEGLCADHLIADKGYDTDAILVQAKSQGMKVTIPPRRSRKDQRSYDKNLYRIVTSLKMLFCTSSVGVA